MTARWANDELLAVLACDIDEMPAAPGPAELAPFITAATLRPDALILEIDQDGRRTAEAFVAAEQVCCAGIGWELGGSPLRLRISAGPEQLNVLAGLVPTSINIEKFQ